MNRFFSYFYKNPLTDTNIKDTLFRDETIIHLVNNIKFEDNKGNSTKENVLYITNYRIICINLEKVYDIPLEKIKKNSNIICKPAFYNFNGSKYISIEIDITNNKTPFYIKETVSYDDKINFIYPEYIYLKFKERKDDNDIQRVNETISYALRSIPKEFKKIDSNEVELSKIIEKVENPRFDGIGLVKSVNQIENKIKEQKNIINSSFDSILSLKSNASDLIKIASNLKAKLEKTDNKDDIEEINKILQKIGFIDPITKEQTGANYFLELAKQINDFFKDYFKLNKGMITLIEAYCIYNRARGVSKTKYYFRCD